MRFLCVFAALAAIVFSSCTRQADTLQQQIDNLSSGRIATLEEQQDNIEASLASLSATDEALTKYVAALEGQIKTMSEAVTEDKAMVLVMQQTVNDVKASQDALKKSMADLSDYLDTGFEDVRGWASGTFATLEQHAALCATVAQLEVSVQKNSDAVDSLRKDMVTECRSMVMDAVKDVEDNIKKWVNEQLAGYWTIEQTQAKLDALSADITKARSELTASYQKYITEAIEEYDGEIKGYVASELKKVNDDLSAKIADIVSRLDVIEAAMSDHESRIATVEEQARNIDSTILVLKGRDTALDRKLDSLDLYVNDTLLKTKDWVSATFATLAQYDALCTTVAAILPQCRKDVSDSLAKVMTSMKNWVNAKLTGYWTIAQTQAKLDALSAVEKADSATLAADIAKAKSDLSAAYTAAISAAITTLEGKLNTKIAADIKTASDALNVKITAIDTRLKAAETSIALLLNQIQSITPVPYYDDGSQRIGRYDAGTSVLEYIIFPDSVAKKVAKKKSLFTVRYTETKMRLSAAYGNAAPTLPVTSVAYSNGVVKVTVVDTGLPADFFTGKVGASACLVVEGDGNSRASQYVPLAYKAGFSVSKTVKVVFAPGNVQYQASTGTWRFAEHQYDIIGNAAGNNTAEASRSTQSAWIDLFGWGATGYNSYSERPYSIALDDSKYKTQSTAAENEKLTIANKGDWGHCLNEGADGWRLMTRNECDYLLETRTDAASKLGFATVASVTGLIILPDVFTDPKVNTSSKTSGGAFVPKATTGFDANVYDASAWEKMENAGAVFLPAGGCRRGASVHSAGSYGYYWVSAASSTTNAHELFLYSDNAYGSNDGRSTGHSVRLVAESE